MENFLDINEAESKFLSLVNNFQLGDRRLILEALDLVKKKHSGQYRDEGPPYAIHPIRVATLLIEDLGIEDRDSVIAALLHDTVEDTDLTLEEVEKKFSSNISQMVSVLTRDKDTEPKQEKFKKILGENKLVRIIKACDWLDNMRSWSYIPRNNPVRSKFPRWFHEAETMYIPLAETVDSKLVQDMKKALASAQSL